MKKTNYYMSFREYLVRIKQAEPNTRKNSKSIKKQFIFYNIMITWAFLYISAFGDVLLTL